MIENVASVYILSKDNKLLLVMHKKYAVFMPVGGHSEGDEEAWETAIREAKEESGIEISLPLFSINDNCTSAPIPFAIQLERITDEHIHRDYLYVTRINKLSRNIEVVTENGLSYRWFTFEEVSKEPDFLWEDVKTHALAVLSGVVR